MKRTGMLALVALTLLITACAPTAVAPADDPERVTSIWQVDAAIVGEPVVRDDMVVTYVDDDTQLRIAAWDLETGEDLWSADALPSFGDPRVLLSVAVTSGTRGDVVFYLAPTEDAQFYDAVVAYMRTGKRIVTDWFASMESRVRACGDNFCFRGSLTPGGESTDLKLDPADGSISVAEGAVAGRDAFRMGDEVHLVPDSGEGPELLHFGSGDGISWTRPFPEIFGARSSARTEWAWHTKDRDPIVGFGGSPDPHTLQPMEDGGSVTIELTDPARRSIAGLDRSTGDTVWRVEGAGRCLALPDPEPTWEVFPVCRAVSGTATVSRTGDDEWDITYDDATQEAIGIDSTTGEIVWTVPLGDIFTGSAPSFFQRDDMLVVSTASGAIDIDHETGATAPVGPSSVLACRIERSDEFTTIPDGSGMVTASTGFDAQPCDNNGKSIDSVTPAFLQAAGLHAHGDTWLVAMPGTLAAYTMGELPSPKQLSRH